VVYGNPEVTTGGRALKFYSTMRLEVRKVETLKQGDQSIGSRVRVKIVKNKVAPPFKQAEFDIMYGSGISREGDTLDCAVQYDIVNKAGAWYSYQDQRIGQGRENVKAYLRENPEMLLEIEERVKKALSGTEEPEDKGDAEVEDQFNQEMIQMFDEVDDEFDLPDGLIDTETGEIF
jgi:recombination protein RecA